MGGAGGGRETGQPRPADARLHRKHRRPGREAGQFRPATLRTGPQPQGRVRTLEHPQRAARPADAGPFRPGSRRAHSAADFALVGKGWEKLGLSASKESSGVPGSKDYYGPARASLNLSGGSTHSGLSLRPYEIACSHGLVFTRYNRELPGLFEPGKECVAFTTPEEMTASLERIVQTPDESDAMVEAGRSG